MFEILEQVATQVCYHVSLTEYCLGWHQSTRCFYPGLPHDEQQESNGGEMQWEEMSAAQENSKESEEKLLHEWYTKVSGTYCNVNLVTPLQVINSVQTLFEEIY